MRKLKTAKLAKVVLAAVLAMSISTTAFAAQHPDNTRGRVVEVKLITTTDADGLGDPNINHPALNHDSECGEYLHDTDLTVGDLNKSFDVLVANEQTLMSKLKDEAALRAGADIVKGAVSGTDIVLTKGDNSTVVIDAKSLVGVSTDTYVTAGSYSESNQTITLNRNNDKPDIDIKLTNVAKQSDLDNLKGRVETNETNISNIQGDVTTIKGDITTIKGDVTTIKGDITNIQGDITNIQGDITNIQGDITDIKGDVTKLKGDTIKDGKFENNTITLNRNSGENPITMNGVASVADVEAEAAARAGGDVVSGSVVNTDIILKKGDDSTVKIDASGLLGSVTDTYVTAGSYNGDSQVITLKRNNEKEDIDIQLTNVAKASDVNNLEQRVENNETNITNIQGDVTNLDNRVTTNETNITNLDNRVSTNETNIQNIDGRVTKNETNIQNLQGDVTNLEERVTTNETNISNLDNRVTTNETNIQNIDGRVTKNETNIQNLQGDVTNLEERVTTNETNIQNLDGRVTTNATNIKNEVAAREAADQVLAGEDIDSGHMNGNTLVLEKKNKKTVEVDGIATTGDIAGLQTQVSENKTEIQNNRAEIQNNKTEIQNNRTEIQNNKTRIEKETSERKAEDARLDNRIDGIEQNMNDLNGSINRLDGKINKGVALAIAHASLKPLEFDPHYKWSGAFGMGSYHGENALAAGVFYQPNRDLSFNISFSTCGSEKSVGGGVSFRFK